MQTFYLTDTGKVREHNEDSVIILNNSSNEYTSVKIVELDTKIFEGKKPAKLYKFNKKNQNLKQYF